MPFGGRTGLVCVSLLFASLLVAADEVPPPALQARIESAFAAWKLATTDDQRTAVRQKYGPYDPDFLKFLSAWGEDFQKGADLPGSIERFKFCAAESDIAGDMFHSTICWQLIAGSERLQGKYADAEAHYKISLEAARKPGGELRIPYVLNNLAGVYMSLGRYGEGIDLLYQAVAYHEKAGRANPAPLQNLAIAYALRGDNARSLAAFVKALALYEKQDDTKKLGLTHYNIGVLQMKQTNYDAAAREFETSQVFSEKAGDKTQLGLTLGDYGRARDMQGHTAEALEIIQRALQVCREQGYRPAYDDALLNLGNFYMRHEDLPKAKAAFEEARTIAANELHDPHNLGLALRGMAFVAYRQKDFPHVLEYTAESLKTAADIGDIAGEWQAAALRAMGLRASGKIAEARTTFERAITLVEKQRGTVAGGDVEQQRFFEEAVYPYRELASLEAEAGNALAGLRAAERARARVLLDVMAGNPEDVDRLMTVEEKKEEKRLKGTISVVNARLARAKAAAAAQIGAERDAAWQAYEAFLQQLYTKYPQLKKWRGDSPVAGEEDLARLVATPGSAIVEFLSGQDELLEFVVTAGKDPRKPQVSVHRIPISRAEVARRAEGYRAMLEARDPAFRNEAHALYTLLLSPAAAELRGKTNVRLIPDGPLWALPFQALSDDAGRYWIESSAISWAHSITFLRDQRATPASASTKSDKELLVVGDPARKDSVRVPILAEQARRIAALYDARSEVLLTGADADEDSFKKAIPGARIVHVAAHGVVDSVNGLHSRLLLAPSVNATGAPEDGWLEAWELMQMKTNADLVVLSACETGRGKAADGEGLLGLTWALFVSGARSAVVSQWRVESESTTELMVGLHQRLRRGIAGDEALRGSVLALMKNPNYRHPMYWAPFIYSGR